MKECEIALFHTNPDNHSEEFSGPWMVRLAQEVVEAVKYQPEFPHLSISVSLSAFKED
jgi:hypothetical protein